MSAQNIGFVFHKELTEWLRDRRTIISTVVIPLLLFPILTIGFGTMATVLIGKAKEEIPKVIVLGGEDSPKILEDVRKLDKIEIAPAQTNWKDAIINKEVRAAVEIPPAFEADLAQQKSDVLKIYIYEGEMKSSFAADRIEEYFRGLSDKVVTQRLAAKNLPPSILRPFEVKRDNVAPPEKVSGAVLGGLVGYMVILLCLTGGMYPAMDLTAGEKERGTMETILSSPISRYHLVLGKFFLVLTAALATAALSVLSMGLSFSALKLFNPALASGRGEAAALMLRIGPATVLAIFVMALPIAVLFSAALMTISLFAKSYKEAQSYVSPLMILVIVPAVAALLPGVELTSKLALIPILNVSLLCKELVTGTYHWNYIVTIFLSTCVYAGVALFLAVKMFQREDVLFRS
jgi:sodium transport system permease protein